MNDAIKRIRPEQALEAAGYIRVSDIRQTHGYSPDVQREAIKRLAAQEGYAITLIEEDVQKGRVVTRRGYQRIVKAVRAGTAHAVLVFMFDRWGRDGAEWLTRAREFDPLGVPIISVQEGHDEGGLLRFVRAGMAEEYARQLGKRVRPSKESSARSGVHQGSTPLGYRRVYPPTTDPRRRPPGALLPDEHYAWVVRALFERYSAGGWSLRRLVDWLNADPTIPAPPGREEWVLSTIKDVLRSPVYCGLVRYNTHPKGFYDRAPAGSEFIVEGRHEGLVSRETFDRVQERLAAARLRPSYNRRARQTQLGTGMLVCACCGGPMVASEHHAGIFYYACGWRQQRKGARTAPCTAPGYPHRLAHEALLTEVRRLRGAPWTPQAEECLTGTQDRQRGLDLQRSLGEAREQLKRHTRLMSLMEDDPTPEQIATFREVSGEISGRIRALEAELGRHARGHPY